MKPAAKLGALAAILGLANLACSYIVGDQNVTYFDGEARVATMVAATLESQSGGKTPILPGALYYQRRAGESGYQVFRLERDGLTETQVTAEGSVVDDYAVSLSDGSVAFIKSNRLYIINSDGSGRRMLVDGGIIDEDSDEYHYTKKISGLSWSPDGSILAYGQNGINLYDIRDGTTHSILKNVLQSDESGPVTPVALYSPNQWSPDSARLLISLSYLEGGTLAVVEPLTGNVTRLGNGVVCCYADWTADGSSIVVGSPHLGLLPSGLWRYDVETGAETILVSTISKDNTLNFASWPIELPNGELRYFYANTPEDTLDELPLTLVRSEKDGVTGRVQLRSENWSLYEALWAEDGSVVVAVEPYITDTTNRFESPIILIDATGGQIIPLVPAGYNLQWGP